MQTIVQLLKYVWPLPYTLVGLAIGLVAMLFGAEANVKTGVVEFQGGFISRLISHMPLLKRFVAVTLGHTILGKSAAVLDAYRAHEQVHVNQYERWGVLFIPAYIMFSIWALMRGKKPYLDNRFEREAYEKKGEKKSEQ